MTEYHTAHLTPDPARRVVRQEVLRAYLASPFKPGAGQPPAVAERE